MNSLLRQMKDLSDRLRAEHDRCGGEGKSCRWFQARDALLKAEEWVRTATEEVRKALEE